jgi:hypothetical protein
VARGQISGKTLTNQNCMHEEIKRLIHGMTAII